MDLQHYVETIHQQLVVAADAGGDDARALAERLAAPLDAAIRLAVQEALTVAAEEITCELAPGSVELRLRGRDLEFVVTSPPDEPSTGDRPENAGVGASHGWPGAATGVAHPASAEGEEGGMSRINLRIPEHLKARVERAADGEGLSVNSWLVRAAAAAVDHTDQSHRRAPQGPQRYTGWTR